MQTKMRWNTLQGVVFYLKNWKGQKLPETGSKTLTLPYPSHKFCLPFAGA